MDPVSERRFFNQFQPQTLQIAVLLLYLNAFFELLSPYLGLLITLLFVAGLVAGGYGIANEWRWAYQLALVVTVLRVVLFVAALGIDVLEFPAILTLIFDGALVGLLVHPMSRDYQRIWFR